MNRDEIWGMALQAAAANPGDKGITLYASKNNRFLEQFAALVEERVRDQCAWECEMAGINGYGTLAAALIIREGSTIPCGGEEHGEQRNDNGNQPKV